MSRHLPIKITCGFSLNSWQGAKPITPFLTISAILSNFAIRLPFTFSFGYLTVSSADGMGLSRIPH